MNFGRNKNKAKHSALNVQTVQAEKNSALARLSMFERQSKAERDLYLSLRESVPVIDAAIGKIVRLMGKFRIETYDKRAQSCVDDFVSGVKLSGSLRGMQGFVDTFIDELLTYGQAVGEMVPYPDGSGIAALYNAGLDDVEIAAGSSPLELTVCTNHSGLSEPVPNQQLVIAELLNPKPGTVHGTSILRSLPFVSGILLRIFESIKTNWERVGDVRFAVTCNPPEGGTLTSENAKQIADEWRKAMRSGSVCDFIAAGDVCVKVIGAENVMPDCEIPVKQLLEQIVAKLGIPPFLLGFSWSSTERMSVQQADILTSELEYYREVINPVIRQIVTTQLRLCGWNCGFDIIWNDINLQDAIELSQARLYNAQAEKLEKDNNLEGYIE